MTTSGTEPPEEQTENPNGLGPRITGLADWVATAILEGGKAGWKYGRREWKKHVQDQIDRGERCPDCKKKLPKHAKDCPSREA